MTDQMVKEAASKLLSRAANPGSPQLAPRAASRALLLSEDSYATVLLLLVLDTYGRDALQWHPDTLRMALESDFGLELPKESLDKIMAGITILTTNYFYKDVRRFIELCNVLSGDDFQPDEVEPADASEVLWGIVEATLIYPPNEDPQDTQYSPEITAYIGEVLKRDGIALPPDVLRLGGNTGAAEQVAADFADDPDMFAAMWEVQQAKRGELVELLQGNLREMAVQLRLLPLENGSTEELLQQMQQVIGKLPTA
jgi:hypothetical protein